MREADGAVGEIAVILGFAGLMPQVAAMATCLFDGTSDLAAMFAFGYGVLILSFIGGIWWGFGMNLPAGDDSCPGQGSVAAIAVVPSLAATALVFLSVTHILPMRWALVILGSTIMTTLIVDRRFSACGMTPHGWMALRIPLAIGLGVATTACGILA